MHTPMHTPAFSILATVASQSPSHPTYAIKTFDTFSASISTVQVTGDLNHVNGASITSQCACGMSAYLPTKSPPPSSSPPTPVRP